MENAAIASIDRIESAIRVIRGQRVLLDNDLARLYGVETRVLNQAVKRNPGRFPEDFMFQLSLEEAEAWLRSRSQFVIMKRGENLKYRPHAFTEQGVAMLSSVLHSDRAVRVNVEIIRAFVRLRRILASHASLAHKLEELEKKYDARFRMVFEAIRQMMLSTGAGSREIGFHVKEGEKADGRKGR